MLGFHKNGYAIVRNFVPEEVVEYINDEIDRFITNGELKFRYGNKIMFAIHKSDKLRALALDKDLQEIVGALFDGKAALFSSINFLTGSQQKVHSDSIHMTTYPLGGLIGAWIALEDIDLDNGPLFYYPESQKLPYYLNSDYQNEGNRAFIDPKLYKEYEQMLEEKINEQQLEKRIFKANKGDLLLWHANLIHGGKSHQNKRKTRKSVVFHYFREDSICYHEITQRPALIRKFE